MEGSPPLRPDALAFVLHEVLEVERLCAWERFAEHSPATFAAAIETAARLAAERFAPHNRKADLEEPRIEDGRVILIPEVKEALDDFAKAGFLAAHQEEALGGMQLPWVVAQACMVHFAAANVATWAYPFLTIAAANLLATFGSEGQKRRYLRPMLEGRFFGTMVMSEPEVGSSLGDLATRASPLGEGRFLIRGTKMWISGGEHELSETIVHLVLARIEGAPPGPKGLSLFAVPRHRVDGEGRIGAANDVALVGLNHKLGWRGTVNTVLRLGERGQCEGELIGQPGQGLAIMFAMMNEARIGVGMSAVALACAGYAHALDYARTRRQGRPPDSKDPAQPPVAIVEHADVRRMLLAQKAICEGGLALGLYAALQVDRSRHDPEPMARRGAALLLDLLTPVIKAFGSDQALRANDLAIQVLGGAGYSRDHPVEQHWRDNRLNPIHEGTNGIQAIDLLGRKILRGGGPGLALWLAIARQTVAEARGEAGLEDFAAALAEALDALERTSTALRQAAAEQGLRKALANASLYLELLGHTMLAWIWLWQALVATHGLAAGAAGKESLYRGKLAACRYVFTCELPRAMPLAGLLADLDGTCLDLDPSWL
jgi:alkylation response protein AidB-like acyl-CoA dehydrogenase